MKITQTVENLIVSFEQLTELEKRDSAIEADDTDSALVTVSAATLKKPIIPTPDTIAKSSALAATST